VSTVAETAPVTIIGSYVSPYVRKVLVCLDLKKIPYRIDPIVPFLGDDRFGKLSPLRRIPVLVDTRVTLSDSSVICQYLEDLCPEPALYPADVADRARARWLEEFADTRLGEVIIWRLFYQLVVRPFIWREKTDQAVVERARGEEIPSALDYLESLAPADGFLFGKLSIADISIAAFFRNAAFAGYTIDASRWPRCAGHVARVLALGAFTRLAPFEECSMRTPPPEQRPVLARMGAPIASESYGTESPRRGVMAI
jgi:glutathione S-transferase